MSRTRTFPITFTCRKCGTKGPRPSNQVMSLVLPNGWDSSIKYLMVKGREPILELDLFCCSNCLTIPTVNHD